MAAQKRTTPVENHGRDALLCCDNDMRLCVSRTDYAMRTYVAIMARVVMGGPSFLVGFAVLLYHRLGENLCMILCQFGKKCATIDFFAVRAHTAAFGPSRNTQPTLVKLMLTTASCMIRKSQKLGTVQRTGMTPCGVRLSAI